jgi:hypothetical protein
VTDWIILISISNAPTSRCPPLLDALSLLHLQMSSL